MIVRAQESYTNFLQSMILKKLAVFKIYSHAVTVEKGDGNMLNKIKQAFEAKKKLYHTLQHNQACVLISYIILLALPSEMTCKQNFNFS